MNLKHMAVPLLVTFLILSSVQPTLATNNVKAYLEYNVKITRYGSVIETGNLTLSNPSEAALTSPEIVVGYPDHYRGKVVAFSPSSNVGTSFDENEVKLRIGEVKLEPLSNLTLSWALVTKGLLSSELGIKYRANLTLIPSTSIEIDDVKVRVTAPPPTTFERVEGFNVTGSTMVGEFEKWKGLNLKPVTLNLPSPTDDLILLDFKNMSRIIEIGSDGAFVLEKMTIHNSDVKDLKNLKVHLLSNVDRVYMVEEFEPFRSQPIEVPVKGNELLISASGFIVGANCTFGLEFRYRIPQSYLKDDEIVVPKGSVIDEPVPYRIRLKLDKGFEALSPTTYEFSPLDTSGQVNFEYRGGPNWFGIAVPYITTLLFLSLVSFTVYYVKRRKAPEEELGDRVKMALKDLLSLLDELESMGTEKVKKKDVARFRSEMDAGVNRLKGEFFKLLRAKGMEAEFGRIDQMLRELRRRMEEYGTVFERFSGKKVRERRVRKLLGERRDKVLAAYESLLDELEKTL